MVPPALLWGLFPLIRLCFPPQLPVTAGQCGGEAAETSTYNETHRHIPSCPWVTHSQGSCAGVSRASQTPSPSRPPTELTPVHCAPAGRALWLPWAHETSWPSCHSRAAAAGHDPTSCAPHSLPLCVASGEKPPMPAPASPSLSNLAMSAKPWFPFHQKRSKLGNWLPAQMPLSLSHV